MYEATFPYSRKLTAQDLFDLVMVLARRNVRYLVDHPETPRLQDLINRGKLRYKDESRRICDADGCRIVDAKWKSLLEALEDGTYDCKTGVGIEIAECWIDGRDAVPLPRCIDCGVRACPRCAAPKSGRMWHVQTLHGDGTVTDPSRQGGMPPHPRGDDYIVPVYQQAGIVRM